MPDDSRYALAGDLPLVISPRDSGDTGLDGLCSWLAERDEEIQSLLTRHGAIRFRGFDVDGAPDFERVARAIDSELKNDYLGTSPRDAVEGYVFNASELPDFYPIPQHCEMSFCATPPRRVFFCCLVEPAQGSGETPLCDFRKVWQDLDPELRDRVVSRGLQIVRNYTARIEGDANDPTMLKPWQEMFLTEDRDEVERQCRSEGFDVEWLEGDALRLTHTQPVYRDHPVSGERVWHNHCTTFHVSTAEAEYRRIAALRPSDRHDGLVSIAQKLEARLLEQAPQERAMHTTHLDGEEIAPEDMEAIRDAVWKNMVIQEWKQGDVVAIDNHSTSHGRLPYEGPRKVVVCWA